MNKKVLKNQYFWQIKKRIQKQKPTDLHMQIIILVTEIYSINLPESKGADFNQNIIAGKRAIKNLLKEIDDEGLLGLN